MTPPGDFWAFSLRVYAEPGVSPALLHWQDEGGADVDIVLYILWRASLGQSLDAAAIDAADAAVAAWRGTVVQPLRAARRALATPPADVDRAEAQALRARVKADELEAERLQHQALERLCRDARDENAGPVDPTAALTLYARRLDGTNAPWPRASATISVLATALLSRMAGPSSA